MVVSITGFTVMGLILRGARADVGPHTAVVWRNVVGLLLVIPAALLTRRPLLGKNIPMLLLRGAAGAYSLLFFFIAIARLDLGTATALCYTYPVFASILSAIFLREPVTMKGWIAIIAAWIGMAIMVGFRPSIGSGELYGILSGVLAGVAIHTVRALRKEGESLSAILFSFFLIGCAVALPGAFDESRTLGLGSPATAALVAVGMTATVGQAALTLGYRVLPTRIGSPMAMLVVPLSMAGSWFLYEEVPPAAALVGGAILLASVMFLGYEADQTPERRAAFSERSP